MSKGEIIQNVTKARTDFFPHASSLDWKSFDFYFIVGAAVHEHRYFSNIFNVRLSVNVLLFSQDFYCLAARIYNDMIFFHDETPLEK